MGNDFVAIAAGQGHNLALKLDGSVIAWGSNEFGETEAPDGTDFVAVAAGTHHSLALMKDGSIVAWGWDIYGRATAPAGNDFVAIAAGFDSSLAIRKAACSYALVGDLNDDCRVDFADFSIIAANWLIDCALSPENPACIPE
jgi:alpha-tubulin suppressor-like RCC1 family protein